MRISLQITRTGFVVLMGMSCLFALESSLFLSGRTFMRITQPVVELLFANLAGVGAGALLMDACVRSGIPFFRKIFFPLILVFIGMCGAVCYVGGWYFPEEEQILFLVGTFCGGVPMAALLAAFFLRIPPLNQGFYMGAAMSVGHGIVLLYVLPGIGVGADLRPALLGFLLLGAGLAAAQAAYTASSSCPVPSSPLTRKGENAKERIRSTIYYMIAVSGCYFMFSGVINVIFFQYDATVPVPRHVFLFVSLAVLFIGLYIDQKGAGIRFLLFCFGATTIMPSLVVISEETTIYLTIYTVCIAARYGVLMFLFMVFARYAFAIRASGCFLCLPYLLQYITFLLVWYFCEITHPGPAAILLPTIFFAGAFGYTSMRVRRALTLLGFGTTMPEHDADVPAETDVPVRDYRLEFSEKFGLSPRESEVLQWLVLGLGPDVIGRQLNVSTATVKTHIGQILRKTALPSRLMLVVKYYTEQPPGSMTPATMTPEKKPSRQEDAP